MIIFLFFSFLSVILSQSQYDTYYLAEKGTVIINSTDNATFLIKLSGEIDSYLNYIDLTLKSIDNVNPMLIISTTDNKCIKDRLFTSTQFHDSIFIFLKKAQLPNNEFFICVIDRENSNLVNYEITIKNEQAASIPYNYQGSYYVSDASTENMEFIFVKDDNEYTGDYQISFWVKGKNIHQADMGGYFKGNVYDLGYVFYGDFQQKEKKLTVGSKIGDFITIGSTVIKDGKIIHEMKENSDEIMVASEEEVCLPIKYEPTITHITGKIYTRKAYIYFADDQGNLIIINEENKEKNITNGILNEINSIGFNGDKYKNGYFCLTSNSILGDKLLIFSIQMTRNKDNHMIHPPLIPGEIRRHFLMKYEWAIFYGMKPKEGAKEVNLNLKSLKGFPEMYYDDCTSFPSCFYTEDSIKQLNHTFASNMITVYSFYMEDKPEYKNYNSITAFQPLMIVYCAEGGKNDFFDEDSFCEFETSYFTNLDTINLYENYGFSQYLLKEEKDNYKINLYDEDGDIIYLDMILFSGDADIIINNFEGEANKYYLSNKIFYSIHLNKDKMEDLNFTVIANSPCFYVIQYQIFKIGYTDDINTIESGVNFITSKYYANTEYVLSTKHIDLINYKYEFDQDYLVDIYSPNCKFEIYWVINENVSVKLNSTEDNYIQTIVNITENPELSKEIYTLFYSIIDDDKSEYPNKFCMIYVSGLELSHSVEEWNNRSISLSEGVPHIYTFNQKYPYIFYAYHISDQKKTLILNFMLIDKGYFEVEILINMIKFKTEKIDRNRIIYIESNYLKGACIEQEVCTINLIVQMKNYTEDKRVELTIYQIDGVPFYLEKNVVKQDVLNGNKVKHYYFDVAEGEYGDITLDFKRGSGNIYASVQKRILDEPMEQPDWRGLYHFPMTNDESLKYRIYGKKIEITEKDTQKCGNGCYVLISIISNMNYFDSYDDETVPYRISITPRIMKNNTTIPSPKVKIDVNEFVLGDIKNDPSENRKYDYYTVTLPNDGEYILIDWQADSPSLIINVGGERPNKTNADFMLPQIGHDFVYELKKNEILSKLKQDNNESLKGITLTIGIYSEINDSIQSSPYAFKIFMPPKISKEDQLIASKIIHIRTDQKVQCLPFNYENKNICLFAVIFDDMDENSNLVLYPRNQADSLINIYGQLVDAEPIERNNVEEIMGLIRETFDKNDFKVKEKYVYQENIDKTKSYFFIIYSDNSESIMEVLSSTYLYVEDMNIFPNPSTAQIFAIRDYNINLNFDTTKDLLLNFVGLSGLGAFYWSDQKENGKKYSLEGYNDRLSLTTFTYDNETKIIPLRVESSTFPDISKGGFIFYITYYPRNNIDQLKIERNTEFHYRTLKMPLYYYAPINPHQNYIINFNFYDIDTKNKEDLVYDTNLFNIWATVITDKEVIKARTERDYKPQINPSNMIKGVFDSSFGNIFLSEKDISRINKGELNETLNLYFAVEKPSDVKYEFDSLGYEINILTDLQIAGEKPASEGIYITGKLSQSSNNKLIYRLPCHKEKPYLRIEYAANSDYVKFALSENIKSEENDKFKDMSIEVKNGRSLLALNLSDEFFQENNDKDLYFIVFSKEKNLNKKLDYFSFMYLSTKDNNGEFWEFLDENKRNITLEIKENEYKMSFYPITILNASYYIKAIYKNELTEGEKVDTIAISESKGKYKQINNPSFKENEKISIILKEDKEISYIKIMARFNFINQKIYYLYKPVEVSKNGEGTDKKNNKTILYICIGISSLLLVIVVILITFTISYNKKNKDLAHKVKKISFVQSGGGGTSENEKASGNLLLGNNE